MIRALFDNCVHTVSSTAEVSEDVLYSEEASLIGRAVPKRRREFATGRQLAREALAHLGVEGFPLLRGDDRAPVWPDGIVGSITHCKGFCGVAVARTQQVTSLGVDVEIAEPLDPELLPIVCTARELARLDRGSELQPGLVAKIIFSAKESVFKCVYTLTGTFLDFQDCEIIVHFEQGTFSIRFNRGDLRRFERAGKLDARFTYDGLHTATGLTLIE